MEDGFYLIYSKDNKALPVVMTKNQHYLLKKMLPLVFIDETVKIVDEPMGEIYNMITNKGE